MLIISGGGGPLRPGWRGGEVLTISGGGPLKHLDQAGGEVRC